MDQGTGGQGVYGIHGLDDVRSGLILDEGRVVFWVSHSAVYIHVTSNGAVLLHQGIGSISLSVTINRLSDKISLR